MSIASEMKIFITRYGTYAQAAAAGSPVFAQTILSAAALESGFGKSSLATKSNNFFGIKADKAWTGRKVTYPTKEQRPDGSEYTVNASFKVYDTPEDSFRNYVKFIQGPRYIKAGVTAASSPVQQFERLQAAGYATDTRYAQKLKNIYNSVSSWVVKNQGSTAAAAGTLLIFFCLLIF